MKRLTSTTEIIDELGGPAAAGRLFQRKKSTVAMWKVSGRFPPTGFLAMSAILRTQGIEAPPSLWSMEPVPPVDQPEARA